MEALIAALPIAAAVAIGVWLLSSRWGAAADDTARDSRLLAPGPTDRPVRQKTTIVEQITKAIDRRNGRSLQDLLERSGSQLRSGEWVLIVIAITVVLGATVFFIGGTLALLLVALMVPIGARALLARNIHRRQEAFADQLPDVLMNLSSALRSGQSLAQAVSSIAPDIDAPAGEELRRVAIEIRIGRDLVQSFRDLAARMESMDFDWVVRAIEINHSTGGDLPAILRRLDATIRARNHVAGTVRSLTAEGRISGVVLTALPPLLMLGVQLINPGYLDPLVNQLIGRVILVTAAVLLVVGGIWLSRLSRFRY